MNIIDQQSPEPTGLPGIEHITWAGEADGLAQLSVWRQTMAPGAATPPHSHDCDEVVLCLAGWGEVHSEGRVQRFGADTTLVLPRGRSHQRLRGRRRPQRPQSEPRLTGLAGLDHRKVTKKGL